MAHSRTLRSKPTTCQTHDPAGLETPPRAYAPPGVELALAQVGLAPSTRRPQDWHRVERIELGHDEGG
jgi:hypothetical protein